ncbi:MAG: efflux RND transporter periplasmic adaptor subunit [bacterium]
MKRRLLWLMGILLLIGCGGRDSDVETEISIPVSVEEVKKKAIEEFIVATGTVYSMQETVLKSEISGYYRILENPKAGRKFTLGDFVNKGQEIIRLEDEEFENNVKLESQQLNLEISKNEFEKQQSLYEKGGVTFRELKNAELAYVNARYSYENALVQLVKMKIASPFYGVIVNLPYYTEGTRVASNQEMVKIMNYGNLYMEVNLPGKELDRIKVGQPVRVMNYTLKEDTLKGSIAQVSPAIDPDTRTFKASLTVENPEWLMRPGMFVKTELVVAREDSALVIPKDVILSKQRGRTVFVVQRGAAQERVITTGLENPKEVEVTSGLQVNDRLVVKGFETLRDRSQVKIIR